MSHKKSICVISFSPIYRDARVLRQIKYLSEYYNLIVIGYGPPHPKWTNRREIHWISIDQINISSEPIYDKCIKDKFNYLMNKNPNWAAIKILRLFLRKLKLLISFFVLGLGRIHPWFYEVWYWAPKYRLKALRFAIQSKCHAFHANDWNTLPLAAKAAEVLDAKILFDAHEYAPLELENRWYWKPFFQPMITYFLKKYSNKVNASVTVAPIISKRYEEEFGLKPEIILNVPEKENIPVKPTNLNQIRLVHHGGAIRDRKLENMIKAVALSDKRFSLHFILLNNDLNYLKELKELAKILAPKRVIFRDPVLPEEVVRYIAEYDIGLCIIYPTNYNYLISLPNKLFDCVIAGLAICVGPSPSMVELINKYKFGCVTSSFEPENVAETLNKLTMEDILKMKKASREASIYLNAEHEMRKLIKLYDNLIG